MCMYGRGSSIAYGSISFAGPLLLLPRLLSEGVGTCGARGTVTSPPPPPSPRRFKRNGFFFRPPLLPPFSPVAGRTGLRLYNKPLFFLNICKCMCTAKPRSATLVQAGCEQRTHDGTEETIGTRIRYELLREFARVVTLLVLPGGKVTVSQATYEI
jgi:hypothetical protein